MLFLIFSFFTSVSFADLAPADNAYISVGAPRPKKAVIAFPEVVSTTPEEKVLSKALTDTFVNDLSFLDLFKLLDSAAFVEKSLHAGTTPGSFKFSDWNQLGADYLIKSSLKLDEKDVVKYEVHVYEIATTKELLSRTYPAKQKEIKTIAHTFGDDLIKALTGTSGIFLTKIAMTCDRTGKKEIYIMNFDGSEVKQITHHRSIAFAPTWNMDNTKIAYSLFVRHKDNVKNIDLFEFNLTNNTIRLLSDKNGMNSGASYAPDGKKLALTMSVSGTPSIYMLDLASRSTARLTHSLAFDVDAAWSPDGKKIAFVSSRTGLPMLFTMDSDGQNPRRLTYAGQFNATPSWSPNSELLAFAGWLDKKFDIFTMKVDGTKIERLTKDQGGNEDPAFSPDGNFITFSSNRTGQKNIYVMNTDGSFVKRLTYGLGNCVAPKWSHFPVSVPTNL